MFRARRRLATGGGRPLCGSRGLHFLGGGGASSFSNLGKDFHGLKGPLARPLDPAVEQATKEYLDFFRLLLRKDRLFWQQPVDGKKPSGLSAGSGCRNEAITCLVCTVTSLRGWFTRQF